MQKLSYILSKYYWVLIVVLVALSFYHYGRQDVKEKIVYKEKKVIEKKVDTITKEIQGKEKEVIKYVDKVKYLKKVTEKVVYDTAVCKDIVAYKDSIINNQDTIIQYKDVIIEKKDTIIMYKDKIIELPKTRKRLGLGVQAGYGIDNRPYVGLGVSYNLFVF